MTQITTIGLDLAKSVFQVHGADGSGAGVVKKKLRRDQVLPYFATLPPCRVAMEACGSAHYWAREIAQLGHDVRLIAPTYVKPFRKRQKNDAADAEAICEAAQRPNMRFVPVKTQEQQAATIAFRCREMLIRQRTQILNAIRSHLAEFGHVIATGPGNVAKLIDRANDPAVGLPASARMAVNRLNSRLVIINEDLNELDREISARTKRSELARRLMTIPGVGPLTATAVEAMAPHAGNFQRGRDFSAWLGITPLQHSTGGKQRLGRMSRMGDRTLRRLIIMGASSVVCRAVRAGYPADSWLGRILARKPRMVAIVALANKISRTIWALVAKGGVYRAPVVPAV